MPSARSNQPQLQHAFPNSKIVDRPARKRKVVMIGKYNVMLNLNVKIEYISKSFLFKMRTLTSFLLASMPSTLEVILNHVNMRDTLASTKPSEPTDLRGQVDRPGVGLKKVKCSFCWLRGFRGRGGRKEARVQTVTKTASRRDINEEVPRPVINCSHCKNKGVWMARLHTILVY